MNISLVTQMYGFGWMVLGGMASGVLFDTFSLVRLLCGKRRFTANLTDLILWICLALGIFGLNFYVNDGALRWYGFCALLIGAILYFLTLSRPIRFLLGVVLGIFMKILRLIFKIVLTTALFLYKIICAIFSFVLRLLRPIGKGARRTADRLGRRWHMLWLAVKKK